VRACVVSHLDAKYWEADKKSREARPYSASRADPTGSAWCKLKNGSERPENNAHQHESPF
jgi:hypothetical protein